MKMPSERKRGKYLKRIIVTLIILGGMAYGAYYVWKQYQEVDTTSMFSGEVACLPLKSSPEQPDKATCEKGMKTKDGLYYFVQDVSQAALKIEEKIAIKGNLDPVTNEVDGDYNAAGIITGELVTVRR
jgi:hypothetical protein